MGCSLSAGNVFSRVESRVESRASTRADGMSAPSWSLVDRIILHLHQLRPRLQHRNEDFSANIHPGRVPSSKEKEPKAAEQSKEALGPREAAAREEATATPDGRAADGQSKIFDPGGCVPLARAGGRRWRCTPRGGSRSRRWRKEKRRKS